MGTLIHFFKERIFSIGAFHSSKPSDLLAELQGRLPIRVTLQGVKNNYIDLLLLSQIYVAGLTQDDLERILTEPVNNLIKQQVTPLFLPLHSLKYPYAPGRNCDYFFYKS